MSLYPFRKLLQRDGRLRAWRLLGATIEDGVKIGPGVSIRIPGKVTIGAGTALIGRVTIDSWGHVSIGRNVLMNDDIMLLTASHHIDSPTFEADVRPIEIGAGAWLPMRIVVLPGVTIGEGAVVGTGSIVAQDVAKYTVVAGNPAQAVSRRAEQKYTYIPSQL